MFLPTCSFLALVRERLKFSDLVILASSSLRWNSGLKALFVRFIRRRGGGSLVWLLRNSMVLTWYAFARAKLV
jgi:hypothetical protein